MWIKKEIIVVIITYFLTASLAGQGNLQKWSDGYLDIHHINTASGDATFFIFPDGTTMLFDLGAIKPPENNPEYFHLKTNKSLSPAKIVAEYIQNIHPSGKNCVLDYAVISHFHADHYGKIDGNNPKSTHGDYFLSGVTEIDVYVPVLKLIDRAYAEYNTPKGLKDYYKNDKTFKNYQKFVDDRNYKKKITEQLVPGINSQITLHDTISYPEFEVRNLKTNLSIWTGQGNCITTKEFDFVSLLENKDFNENPLSLALLIRYGDFDYFTGGDMTGYYWRNLLDMETPLANSIGEIDAMVLNHHGFHDATNEFFMKTLNPKVVVNQSRHTPHFQFTPLEQILNIKTDFYVNNLHNSTYQLFSKQLKKRVKGKNGHIVIRVSPKGEEYNVYVIDDDDFEFRILKKQGPYKSKSK